jgi:hypothetical protein
MTAAKFMPLILSMSGFALSNIANIFIIKIGRSGAIAFRL